MAVVSETETLRIVEGTADGVFETISQHTQDMGALVAGALMAMEAAGVQSVSVDANQALGSQQVRVTCSKNTLELKIEFLDSEEVQS